jgi:hypothetical protein
MSGIQGAEFVVVRGALAFPCFRVGMLALPLCGAAPTFFAAAKKVGKESRSHRQCDAVHHSPTLVVVPERLSPRTIHASDKALIPPAARYARHGRVCEGNLALSQPFRSAHHWF